MTMIPMAQIREIAPDMRTVRPTKAEDDGLAASLAELGQLEAVLVRPLGVAGFRLLHGRRRFAALKAAGATEIDATIREVESDVPDDLVDGAANMVHAPIHPIDRWRLVRGMTGAGMTVGRAADSLGLTARETQRMVLLSKIHPPIVEAMATGTMPTMEDLRTIANADMALQVDVWRHYAKLPAGRLDWEMVAGSLECASMRRDDAKFGAALAKKHGVHWEEDLFAQPAKAPATNEFTRNIAGFVAAQREWLETVQIPALVKKGYDARLYAVDKKDRPTPPKKGERVWNANADKAPKNLARFYFVHPEDGCIKVDLYKMPEAAKPVAGKAAAAALPAAPIEEEPETAPAAAAPAPAPDPTATATLESSDDPLAAPAAEPEIPAGPPPRHGLSGEGRYEVARLKTEAVRGVLRGGLLELDHVHMLAAMVLAVAGRNVRVEHGEGNSYHASRVMFGDLAARLVLPDGSPREVGASEIYAVADEALARLISAAPVDMPGVNSGPAFDWVARRLRLGPPRYDTAEVLAQASGALLKPLAKEAGVKPTQPVKALQRELVGKAPLWVPDGGGFDAAGPEVADG